MKLRSHLWADLTRSEIATARDAGALVVVPVGATEQHADHLPVGTDSLTAARLSLAAAEACAYPVLVAPAVPVGFSPHHASWPGTLTLSLATLGAYLDDVTASIARAGFTRQLLVNGHGGNRAPLMSIVSELVTSGREVGCVDYFAPAAAEINALLKGGSRGVTHAAEAETSLVMALEKDVAGRMAFYRERAGGLPPRPKTDGDRSAIAAAGAWWPSLFLGDDVGYNGDPAAGSLETGERLIAVIVEKLAAFYAVFATADLDSGIRPPAQP